MLQESAISTNCIQTLKKRISNVHVRDGVANPPVAITSLSTTIGSALNPNAAFHLSPTFSIRETELFVSTIMIIIVRRMMYV